MGKGCVHIAPVSKGPIGIDRQRPNRRLTLHIGDVNMASRTPKNPETPATTFSPEALSALLNEVTESRKLMAAQMAEIQELKAANAAKPKAVNGQSVSAKNELATIRAFKKAGYGVVVPHKDVKTFNRFLAEGLRPKEDSKSLKVSGLRLFHISQCRPLSAEELKAMKDQPAAPRKGNAPPVTELHPQ
jgi:hypothetical protein